MQLFEGNKSTTDGACYSSENAQEAAEKRILIVPTSLTRFTTNRKLAIEYLRQSRQLVVIIWRKENMDYLENVYDIRKKEKLMYVLSKDVTSFDIKDELASSVAVAVNLYYEDMKDYFFTYLAAIPEKIRIYIISSNPLILDAASIYFEGKKNVVLLEKNNRGRDISALLVAFREIAFQYQYICFIHDKKPKYSFIENDVNFWIRNLWENTIGSREFIYNVLEIFESTEDMGLLVPPEPIGDYMSSWFKNAWDKNYELAFELAEELQLKCNMNADKPSITLGTVFWARTAALDKLLEKEWSYADFPKEPLPNDGTISHAIERILGYVAQDAGYKTGTIMTNKYAESFMLYLQDAMQDVGKFLERTHHIHTIHQVREFDKQKESIVEFFHNNEKIFLYGAGMYGKELLDTIRTYELEPDGFVVTSGKNEDRLMGIPVYNLAEISPAKDTGIIVAVSHHLQEELVEILNKSGHSNYIIGYP